MAALALPRAAHPEPAVAVTAGATLLAVAAGHAWAAVAVVALTVAASQLAVGWHNDWLDAERDARVGRPDKPLATGEISRRAVGIAAAVAASAVLPLALLAGGRAAATAALGLGAALLYNWVLKSTVASVLPYLVSFAALPSFVVLALPGAPAPPVWLPLAGALLGGGAHFANVLPDLADDAKVGVRGLPHRLGAGASRAAAAALLLASTVTLVLGPPGSPSWPGIAATALAVVVLSLGWYLSRRELRRGERPVSAFRAVILLALVDVVLLVGSGRLI